MKKLHQVGFNGRMSMLPEKRFPISFLSISGALLMTILPLSIRAEFSLILTGEELKPLSGWQVDGQTGLIPEDRGALAPYVVHLPRKAPKGTLKVFLKSSGGSGWSVQVSQSSLPILAGTGQWSPAMVFHIDRSLDEVTVICRSATPKPKIEGLALFSGGLTMGEDDKPVEVSAIYGQPAPAWLRNQTIYASHVGWYKPQEGFLKYFKLISHLEEEEELLEKMRKEGLRAIPYLDNPAHYGIDFSEIYRWAKDPSDRRKGRWGNWYEKRPSSEEIDQWRKAPRARFRDLTEQTNLLFCTEEGKRLYKYGTSEYIGHYYVCLNAPGAKERYLEWVKFVMEMGFSGVFIDNVGGYSGECAGPKYGWHQHVWPEKSLNQIHRDLLTEVYQMVKGYSSGDNIIMFNCHANPQFWPYADALMEENGISNVMRQGAEAISEHVLKTALRHQEAIQAGKVLVQMNRSWAKITLPLEEEPWRRVSGGKDLGFYCYAASLVSGFLWTDTYRLARGGGPDDFNSAIRLYSARLGERLGGLRAHGQILYVVYQHGLAVLNLTGVSQQVELNLRKTPIANTSLLVDLYDLQPLTVRKSCVTVTLPRYSGRIYGLEGHFEPAPVFQSNPPESK